MGGPTSFEDLCLAMEELIQEGKIRGWGLCNDNAYGLTGCTRTAKLLGTTPPCNLQGDFSILDRKVKLEVCDGGKRSFFVDIDSFGLFSFYSICRLAFSIENTE